MTHNSNISQQFFCIFYLDSQKGKSPLIFISDLISKKLCILTSASRLVIRVLDVREVSYPDSSSSDSLDDLDIFNHPPVARRQNRGRGSRAAARSS